MSAGHDFNFYRLYAKAIINFYPIIKKAAYVAKEERTKSRRNALNGMGVYNNTHKDIISVPVARCEIEGRSIDVPFPFLWLEVIENSLDYLKVNYGEAVCSAIKQCTIDNGSIADAAARYDVEISRLQVLRREFVYVVMVFAGKADLLFVPAAQ